MSPRYRVSTSRAARRHVRRRRGFTLVELMVALGVFSIAVLAMMGSSALVMTMIGGSQRRTVATTVAESRFERLRSESCAAHKNGSAVTRGVNESWEVIPLARADDVTVRVSFPSSGGRISSQIYRTYMPC